MNKKAYARNAPKHQTTGKMMCENMHFCTKKKKKDVSVYDSHIVFSG